MIPTAIALSLSTLGLLLSIVALFVALRSSGRSLLKRFDALSMHLSELDTQLDAQNARIKSVRSQVHAAKLSRAANSEVPEIDSTGTEEAKDRWTRETNLKIARGEINPRRVR